MPSETCVLRTLNLCDGQRVVTPRSGVTTSCYSAALSTALALGHDVIAQDARYARARAIARAPELQRIEEFRARLAAMERDAARRW